MHAPRLSSLLLATVAAGCFLFAGCSKPAGNSATPGQPVKVRFQTDWFPQPEHGGYYQALAKGYYAAEGLEVEILPGGPNAQVMSGVATGRADLGMTNGDDIIVAIARGVPLRMIAAEMQRDPQGILFHQEHPLASLRDLDGKTIMAGAGSTWLEVVRKKLGIRFNLQPLIGDLARFMNDPRFIQQCFVTNEPYFATQRGAKVGALLIANAELGYEPYRAIFGGHDYLAKHPDIAARFVRASIRGWTDYLTGDPEPANALLRQLRPDLTPEFIAYSIQAMKDYQLVLGDPARGESTGQLKPERLQRQIDLLQELGVLDRPVRLEDVVTFEFLP
ncbi:MAG TPA: ABC transporter substrate-binding protein [Opitutaceae bacterium]|nr:ABC transporter substrate-binding protein [Opitutaceae bacterium]HRJ45786.1 ABC transporter substrate-binding protein [Opitutaceae bacterium]